MILKLLFQQLINYSLNLLLKKLESYLSSASIHIACESAKLLWKQGKDNQIEDFSSWIHYQLSICDDFEEQLILLNTIAELKEPKLFDLFWNVKLWIQDCLKKKELKPNHKEWNSSAKGNSRWMLNHTFTRKL